MAWELFGFSIGKRAEISDAVGLTGDSPQNVSFVAPEKIGRAHV